MNNLTLLVGFALYRNWSILISYITHDELRDIFRVIMYATLVFISLYFARYARHASSWIDKPPKDGPPVLFFPSKTTHTRFFPKKHSFSYSYLLVGVPIGWSGSCAGMISVDHDLLKPKDKHSSRTCWFSINAEDYLDRGYGHLGLEGKLRKHLEANASITWKHSR